MIKNDIVFAGSGETVEDIGKSVAFVDNFDAYVGGDSIVLSPLIQIDSSFMSYQLNDSIRRIQLRKLGQGSSVIHIYSSGLSELAVHLPPLPEQIKIAKILSSVDEVIETTETQINKLKDLKKGMMNELLTKGIGHTEFKDSPVGRIPVGWEVKTLLSFAKDEKGSFVNGPFGSDLLSSELTNKGVPVIYVRDISAGRYLRKSVVCVTEDKADTLIVCNIILGDVIISKVGDPPCEAGVYKNTYRSIITQDVIRIRPNDKINSHFLSYVLNSALGRKVIDKIVISGTRKRVSLTEFKKIHLPVPPLLEQQKIASILTSIDTNIEQKQTKLTQSKNLKKSLMADLLTGRVRVKPDKEQQELL